MNDEKIVCDAIFGFITLKPYITAIIDTPEFQRLRNIWQLGLTPFVYPTAHHSRFEHSIGTYWLASKLIRKLQKQLLDEGVTEIEITDKDVMCVEIAALCHDIGHGPFSHFWDQKVVKKFGGTNVSEHESLFEEIWNRLKINKKVADMIEDKNIGDEDVKMMADLITGKVYKGKEILFGIVSNKESGMDVDKWDYLARDATYLGHSTSNFKVDIERLLHFARAVKDEEKDIWKIAFRDTETLNILRVFQLRYYMHQTAYQHRKSVTIGEMMLDGIEECITNNIFDGTKIGTVEWILQNTDAIFWSNISRSKTFERILCRDLYTCIFEAVKYEDVQDPSEDIKEKLSSEKLSYHDIRFAFCHFSLGNKNTNPMLNIPFYNKNPEKGMYKFTKENIPNNLEINCNESRILVFTISEVKPGIKESLKSYFEEHQWKIKE